MTACKRSADELGEQTHEKKQKTSIETLTCHETLEVATPRFVGRGETYVGFALGDRFYRVPHRFICAGDTKHELQIQRSVQRALRCTPWRKMNAFRAHFLGDTHTDIPLWAKTIWNFFLCSEKNAGVPDAKKFLRETMVIPYIPSSRFSGNVLERAAHGKHLCSGDLKILTHSIFDILLQSKYLHNSIPGISHNDLTAYNTIVADNIHHKPFYVTVVDKNGDFKHISINPNTHTPTLAYSIDFNIAQTGKQTNIVKTKAGTLPFLGITETYNPKYDHITFLASLAHGARVYCQGTDLDYKVQFWCQDFLEMVGRHFSQGYSESFCANPESTQPLNKNARLLNYRPSKYLVVLSHAAKLCPQKYARFMEESMIRKVCDAFGENKPMLYPEIAQLFGIKDENGPFTGLSYCPDDLYVSPVDWILLDPFFKEAFMLKQ
jgi:hypothetical protein